ncbi:hypothetical protein JET14_12835 [Martelella lutilitoris]|uniref:Holin n=1 Tax=Martelella lutilitoris TaxID=2583532 RepID=A0A7T7HHD7_9HYPH|nr:MULTISPECIES: hypothetical protein [Martelella]AMM85010.1 hypothetical protein AZF01_12100 [Martelella sp. AD-3]MAM09491.1 hypothetical protein [Rhizobiaceae bacterium]QQM29216.1 hypothetical protein JET14_12835 [Martelella lutilitoris]
MDNTKKWYLSKTVWGALLAIAAPLFQMGGLYLDDGTQSELAASIATLAGASGGLVALFGRIAAKGTLSR